MFLKLIKKNHIIQLLLTLIVLIFVISFSFKQDMIYNNFKAIIYQNTTAAIEDYHKREKLVSYLKKYSAIDKNNQPLKLLRLGRDHDGGYVTPDLAAINSDVILGYGIADDASFEEHFSNKYNIPSFGFDCGQPYKSNNPQFTFIPECISSDKFLYKNAVSNKNITTFNTQLKNLNLKNKKVFIKMDIEGAEYEALDEILNYQQNVTGIVLEIHFSDNEVLDDAIKLLSNINKHFLLLHLHANNCPNEQFSVPNMIGKITKVIELTYINKNLVKNYKLSENQSYPTDLDMKNNKNKDDVEYFEILVK